MPRKQNESQKRTMQDVSQGLDVEIISYEYSRMRWKNGTNLDHVGEEALEVVEIEVGAWELVLDEVPDPFHERSEGNI